MNKIPLTKQQGVDLATWVREDYVGKNTEILRIESICPNCDRKDVCVTSHECLNKYVPFKCPLITEHLVTQNE